jgi:hypothetical protein
MALCRYMKVYGAFRFKMKKKKKKKKKEHWISPVHEILKKKKKKSVIGYVSFGRRRFLK